LRQSITSKPAPLTDVTRVKNAENACCLAQSKDTFMPTRRQLLKLFTIALLAIMTSASYAENAPKVAMKTSMGDLVIEVYPDKAPKTVENFLTYVKSGFYNGTVFHRIINGFMIQGGGYDAMMREKPTRAPIQNEAKNGLKNRTYTIAMARTPEPNSATAQFFINVNDNAFLDYPGQDGWGYAVFGKVISGTETVDKIKAVETDRRDKPKANVVIESASILE
jgi:peptidyl-prolyl cis-trans isomerase A (cyclophilin A)/peptidyl-prolyl cis-trans isomerase B (cyclophilin B)